MNRFGVSLLSVAALAGWASPVRAAFTYDFEALTTGQPLDGQDGWSKINAADNSPTVGTGTGTNTSVVALGAGTVAQAFSEGARDLPSSLRYTALDTAAEFTAQLQPGTSTSSVSAGVAFGPVSDLNNRTFVGFEPVAGGFMAVLFAGGTMHTGVTVTSATDWYQFTEVIDFSKPGGEASVFLNDLTTLTPGASAGFNAVPLKLKADSTGGYTATHVVVGFANTSPAGAADNLFLSTPASTAIPLPPALVNGLLTVGLGIAGQSLLRRFRRAM